MLVFVFLAVLAIWPSYQRLIALALFLVFAQVAIMAIAGGLSAVLQSAASLAIGLAIFLALGAGIVKLREKPQVS